MTKAGIKTEDYREINEYWAKRLINHKESPLYLQEVIRHLINYKYYGYTEISEVLFYNDLFTKEFESNVMTLGYPSSSDTDRILTLEHKGIEIGYGKPEWGAEPNKFYFIIKHGQIIK